MQVGYSVTTRRRHIFAKLNLASQTNWLSIKV